MEKKKINIIKIGEVVPVPKDLNPRDTASFHRSLENRQRSQEAKLAAGCESKMTEKESKETKKQKKETSKVDDPCYFSVLLEEIFVKAWTDICTRNELKLKDKVQNQLGATTKRINKMAGQARDVVPDVYAGTSKQELMQQDSMTKEGRHTLAVNKFGIKVPQDNEKIMLDEESNSKTYEELEKEYQKNNEEIRTEWNKMMEERRKKAQLEKQMEDKENESESEKNDGTEKQTDKYYNENDICSLPSSVDMATDVDESDAQSSSHDHENARDLHSSESNPDTPIAMETSDVVDSAPTPKTKTRKTWGSRIRGFFSCFSGSKKSRDPFKHVIKTPAQRRVRCSKIICCFTVSYMD